MVPFSFGEGSIDAGQSATLQCTLSEGDLPLTIMWLYNDIPIKSSEQVTVSKISKRVSVLTLEPVTHELVGNYTCLATNAAGKASFTAQLNVDGTDLFGESSQLLACQKYWDGVVLVGFF